VSWEFGALKRRLVSGVFVTAGAQVLRQVVQLLTIVLLARLLEPSAFGLLALAVAVLACLQMIADLVLGTSSERQELTASQESTLLRLNLGVAALLAVAAMAVAPLVAWLFSSPDLTWVLRALAPCFLLAGALRTRSSSLARALRFRALAAVELTAIGFGAGTSIALALAGWGKTALVCGAAAQQLAWSVSVLCWAGLPRGGGFALASVKPLIGFGGYLTAFNVVNFMARKLDDFLVGGLMGVAALGLYEKSYALMMLPVTQLTSVIGRVMYPVLSKVKDDPERFAFLYLGAVRKIAGLSLPLAALCATQSETIVNLVLGWRFREAVPIFALLSLVMGVQPIVASSGWVFMSRGKMGRFFAWGVLCGILFCASFVAGAAHGTPLAVAQAFVIASALMFLPTMALTMNAGGIPMRALLGRLVVPAVASVAGALATFAAPGAPFVISVALLAGVYAVVHALLDRHAFLDLFRFLDPRRALAS
jgi:PST family polysaccharide transporter